MAKSASIATPGLVRWGYYMDHLLDYFFLCSVIIGYAFILPERSRFQLLLMLALFAAYDFSTFLAFSATDELKISHLKFGPTEFRLALIIINGLLISFGTRYMISGLKWVNAGAVVGLVFLIYGTHKRIWQLDMKGRQAGRKGCPGDGSTVCASKRVYVLITPSQRICGNLHPTS